MNIIKERSFNNGCVILSKIRNEYLIETTDTFLPFYTKDAVGRKQNNLTSCDLGSRNERWMVGVSVMSGCPVRCKFCATGNMKSKPVNLTADEIVEQVMIVVSRNPNVDLKNVKEFKINYTRMGEPFLNIDNVRTAINILNNTIGKQVNIHHYISTIGIKDSDFSWITGNITLQLSLHSLNEERRNELIPMKNKMTIEELGSIRVNSNLKTTVNMTLVDEKDFDIDTLKRYFDPKYFFIKLSPINENVVSVSNALGSGIIEATNLM